MSALKSFSEVVSLYYGTVLHPEFRSKIAIFARYYMKLGITLTSKEHAFMFLCCWVLFGEQIGDSVKHGNTKHGRGIK